ncbi:hypothetical protein R1flu_012036 [Riccia fluitans]|uniref:RRM domain-containing protein n=1 Tax=Riccia fluitans TaxID=41844 RepID=A0ABD1ZBY8_9MARC
MEASWLSGCLLRSWTVNIVSNVLAWSLQNFYEDIFEELSKYGELESLNVCDNLADHMVGNVYVQFREEEQAAAMLQADILTNGR